MSKGIYIGVNTNIPIYENQEQTVTITADNISNYFTVTNGTYYFAGSGSTFTTNNGGKNSTTATTTLTAKQDISALSFNYSYSSEANYDKFTLKVAGTTVENAVSGTTTSKSYSGTLSSGQTIEFTYAKDSSQSSNDDKCTFSNMSITCIGRVQTGSETKSVARRVKGIYIGVQTPVVSKTSGGTLNDGDLDGYGYFASSYSLNNETLQFTINCNIKATIADAVSNGYFCPANNGQLLTSSGTYTASTICKASEDLSHVSRLAVDHLTASLQGIARKVKKGYIGIGGVARQFFASSIIDDKFVVSPTVKGTPTYGYTISDDKKTLTMTLTSMRTTSENYDADRNLYYVYISAGIKTGDSVSFIGTNTYPKASQECGVVEQGGVIVKTWREYGDSVTYSFTASAGGDLKITIDDGDYNQTEDTVTFTISNLTVNGTVILFE